MRNSDFGNHLKGVLPFIPGEFDYSDGHFFALLQKKNSDVARALRSHTQSKAHCVYAQPSFLTLEKKKDEKKNERNHEALEAQGEKGKAAPEIQAHS